MFRSSLIALLLAADLCAFAMPAMSADQLSEDLDNQPCADPRILKNITTRFDYQVKHVPNLPDVSISDFRRIHQHRYIPADDEERPIARRYCGATVALSDGRDREIWYMIEERMSFATLVDGFGMADEVRGSYVEFCVSGFDRWLVYNGACRVLR